MELSGGDGGEGLHEVGGKAFVDIGDDHLAVTFGDFEGAVDAADKIAHHKVAHAFEFSIGDGLLPQTYNLEVYLFDSIVCGLCGHIGGDEEDDAVAEYLCLAVDAVGVAFVFAQVAHEA